MAPRHKRTTRATTSASAARKRCDLKVLREKLKVQERRVKHAHYEEKKSQAKKDVNQEFVDRALALPGRNHHLLILDGPNMQTSRMCIAAGIKPENITVVERLEDTYQEQCDQKLGVKLVLGDFFEYLKTTTTWQPKSVDRFDFPTIIFADLMGATILFEDRHLTTIAAWRAKADRLFPSTKKEFMFVSNVCCRNRVSLSPLSRLKLASEDMAYSLPFNDRMSVFYEAVCTSAERSLFSPLSTRRGARPNLPFGVEWTHAYRRDPKSALMYMCWLRSNPPKTPLLTPRKLGKEYDGMIEVYYYCVKEPVLEEITSDSAQLLLKRAN